MSADNGGPAFPCDVFAGKTHTISDGMTLRDYSAIHADLSKDIEEGGYISPNIASELMHGIPPSWVDNYFPAQAWWFEAEARLRYMKADAMLKAREVKA